MADRQQLQEEYERLRAHLPEARAALCRYPGVVKVAIGRKEVDGHGVGQTAYRVFVEEKKPADQLEPPEVVPEEFAGFPTDVVEVPPEHPEALPDRGKYRPLQGGAQISPAGTNKVGTLGCIATLVSDGSTVVLSNEHVLYADSAEDDTEVGQPNHETSCCCTCNEVAVNVVGINRDHLDCAIARLDDGVSASDDIIDIGPITGIADAIPRETVKKRGRTTGLTEGVVTDVEEDDDTGAILKITVKTDDGNDRFSKGGDSGSALLNEDDEIVGLHYAGNNRDDVEPGDFVSFSIGIQEVLDALADSGHEIEIRMGGGDDEAAPAMPALVGAGASVDAALHHLETQLAATAGGRRVLDAVRAHEAEVFHLVNHRRRVTVTWHRNHGPSFAAALVRSMRVPGYALPDEIEGVSLPTLLVAMATVLELEGSAELAAAVREHRPAVLDFAARYRTLDAALHDLEAPAPSPPAPPDRAADVRDLAASGRDAG